MSQQQKTQDVPLLHESVEKYLLSMAYRPFSGIDAAIGNAYILQTLPVATQKEIKGILSKEAEVGAEVMRRYFERYDAVWAKKPDAEQQKLIAEYGLRPRTFMRALVANVLGRDFNIQAQNAATSKDIAEVAAKKGYDIVAGRKTLDKYSIFNIRRI